MLAAYTELKNAQKVKQYLLKNNLSHPDYLPITELGLMYFPLINKVKVPRAKFVNTKFKFPKKGKKITIDDFLKKKLTTKQLKLIPRSQEIIGDILILEIPEELEKKEKIIAEAYLKFNKNVFTIVKKSKMHSGVFRTRKVEVLAGLRNKQTIHNENGIQLKIHLEKVYFSARSANERLRIAKQVKKGENVLIMFSGAGPFPIVIAKNSEVKKVYGIELNPIGYQLALENVLLNNLVDKVDIINGDVQEILPKIRKKFDRIAMPLPKTSQDFLPLSLKKSHKGTIIHLYSFLNEKDINSEAKKIKEICFKEKKPVKVIRKVKCGQFSPSVFRVCFDLKVL